MSSQGALEKLRMRTIGWVDAHDGDAKEGELGV
jgi:hypothetical protein